MKKPQSLSINIECEFDIFMRQWFGKVRLDCARWVSYRFKRSNRKTKEQIKEHCGKCDEHCIVHSFIGNKYDRKHDISHLPW